MSLRTRLTAAVAVCFAVLVLAGGWIGLVSFESHLRGEQERLTREMLTAYMQPQTGRTADDTLATFYLDESMQEMAQEELFERIVAAYDLGELDAPEGFDPSALPEIPSTMTPEIPLEEPFVIDRGEDVIAIVQKVAMPDGTPYYFGFSNPLASIERAVAPVRTALLVGGPLLVAAAALATWVAVGQVLRPMEAIRRRAQSISSADLSQRVPEPGRRDEVSALAATVNEMLARLETAQIQQRRFIADASHELRSPVAAARTQLEVGVANPEDADWEKTAGSALREIEILGSLIDDLFAMTHLDDEAHRRLSPTDIAAIVREEAARRAEVSIDVPEELWAMAEEPLLRRAVRNLVDNALRHAAGRVRATVRVDAADGAQIIVDDDGPGIPPAERERVFERFVRLDDSRTRESGGAGLGLSIVEGIVQRHDGQIAITESPWGGARFVITLPRVEA